MTVERFHALGSDYDESPTGMFVYAKDYDALAARVEALENALRQLLYEPAGTRWDTGIIPRIAAARAVLDAVIAEDKPDAIR